MAKIADFIAQYPNNQTRMAYASAIYGFLCFVYNIKKDKKVTPKYREKYELLADRYLSEERNHSHDLVLYAAHFGKNPAKTTRCYVSTISEFMVYHDIQISEKDTRSLKNKMPKGGAATVEREFDTENLRALIHHFDLMMKALILLLASSGIRIGEALQLVLEDIDISGDIGHITIRAEVAKNRQQRYTFCSKEAMEALNEWMKVREKYLRESLNRGKGLGISKDPADPRIFPVSGSVVREKWDNAIRAAGLHSRDRVTNRLQVHPHMLRKFFSSQLRIMVPVDIVEGLIGHTGYLSDSYRRYTKKQVEEFYRKGEPYVTLSIPEDIRDFQNRFDQKMQAHTEIIETLVRENMQLKKDMAELKSRTEILTDQLNQVS